MKTIFNRENEKAKAMFRKKQFEEKMKQMGAAKFRAFMLKQVESEDGKSVEFPDIEETEAVEVGDRIVIDEDTEATGTVTLKDGAIITYKDGFVTEVDYSKTEPTQAKVSTSKPMRVKQCSKGHTVKIFGNKEDLAYKIGNEVTIDDKPRMMGTYSLGKTQIAVYNGKITSAKRVEEKPVARQLFKKK